MIKDELRKTMKMRKRKTVFVVLMMLIAMSVNACGSVNVYINDHRDRAQNIVSEMSMDDKISQMIIPAIRTWNEENVTDLNRVPELKEALKKHQYGGIILFGSNITGSEQVTRLIYDLQENNAQNESASVHIPYLTPVDEEGGIVIRLTTGTRMTGNMAIGATPDPAGNALKTGEILGEELAAAGFNVDFAPDIDVNNNPSNPVIGTRSFSDDPELVAELGMAYSEGLSESNIIATFKHFPGHGDTCVDSHIGTPSVEKTYDELRETELVPFQRVIENGADMIMTAHITYPLIDEDVIYGDGKTRGFYPATMSKRMVTDILRNDMGYDGVVVTDALEMDAIRTAGLVEGEEDSSEYRINIAEKVINAGVDMLLIPADMNNEEMVALYDEYISGIAAKVESGDISEERINESVKRILELKIKYGIFDDDGDIRNKTDVDDIVQNSMKVIGSKSHHDTEQSIARDAITLIKNDNSLLPVSGNVRSIELLGRLKGDEATLRYAVDEMKSEGMIDDDTEISFDYYYDSSADIKLNYTEEMKQRISSADVVIGFSYASGSIPGNDDPQYTGIHNAMEDVHAGGGSFILVSENLPYDAALYQDADAIVLAYLGSGLAIDPTDKTASGTVSSAINENIIAAVETIFGYNSPKGKLPVNIPVVEKKEDGTPEYGKDILYERGFGLKSF
jgi:beta-N-acetylhexosaminidase